MLHDPSITGAKTCFYVFNAHVATTLHEPRKFFSLETNIPMKASVTSHRPTYFVWTMPFGVKPDDESFLLRVTPFVHMVDVYVQPLHKSRGFPKRPDPGEPLPSSIRQLVQETPESATLTLRVGRMWRRVPGVEWLPVCEPSDLATAEKDDESIGTDTEDVFHPLDACQILISVFDHHIVTDDAKESREVGFGIHLTSGRTEAVEICSFGETISLIKEDFTGLNKTKSLLFYQDNPGAEIHFQAASQDPYFIEKMTAAVFHNPARLHEELKKPEGCQLGNRGKFCWIADMKQDPQGGSLFDLVIKPEERVTEHRDFLYVTLYLNATNTSEFQPSVEFTATQSSLFTPLKNNIDSDTYSVTKDKPSFFSFESRESTGQLILTLDPDRAPPKKSEDHHVAYQERIRLPLQKTQLFVQSCNTETFVRGLWSPLLAPSPMLHSDAGYINERDQIVAIVNNNWENTSNGMCVYRIGVYSTSEEPFYFRMTATLIHRSIPMAVAVGSTILAHVSKKPQVLSPRGGQMVARSLAVADKFTFRLWKNPSFDGLLVAAFEVCSGTAALRWNDRLSNILGSTTLPGIFLGSMQRVSRRTDASTLQQQGRLYRVVKAKSAGFLGASSEFPEEREAEGYIRQTNSTFSITMNNLADMLCLAAESEDVTAEISAAPWYEQLRHAFTGSRWNLNVSWKPLLVIPAKTALSEDGNWACSRKASHEWGKRVVPEHVQYEVFVAPANATKANWLASCGLYMDAEYYKTTTKYVIRAGQTSFSLPLEAQRPHAYKVAVLAKHIPQVFKQETQPFTYRYAEVELASKEELISLGFTYLLLFALAIALMFACRRNFLARLRNMGQLFLGGRATGYRCQTSQREGVRGIELCRSPQGYMPPPSTLGCSSLKPYDDGDSFSEDPFNVKDEGYTVSPVPRVLEPWAARDHT
ncbi:transmembrane [Cystoisospora suis]|uniref:Transmembrane n=1 Tax=Cystoisospora suis TaxID=483139 RepID=A0A2C6KSX1_9APIC|nr:transmembrane [Cystoisospora suis]